MKTNFQKRVVFAATIGLIAFENTFAQNFTRVETGAIATDIGESAGGAWGDYNNDGFEDLFVV